MDRAGIKEQNLDRTVWPGQDFYRFSCGGWLDANPLPDDFSSYGTYDELAELNRRQLKDLIDGITAQDNAPGSDAARIADLYGLVMDTERRDRDQFGPLKPYREQIRAIKSREELLDKMIELDAYGVTGYFDVGIGPDLKDSRSNIVGMSQGGLTLGDKEYYTDRDMQTRNIRKAFKKHVVRMLMLAGYDRAEASSRMNVIWRIEMRLAKASRNNVQLRDPAANYHKMSLEELYAQLPGLDWNLFFERLGMKGVEWVDVGQPEAIREAIRVLDEEPLEDQKILMEWQLIDSNGTRLGQKADDADFDFYGRTLSGQKEPKPMWKRATSVVSGTLGDAIGRLYVERYFPAGAKERMIAMFRNLKSALGRRIDAQEWLSSESKALAHEKLDAFSFKIGYPDKWRDYSRMVIDPSKSLVENAASISRFFWNDMVERKFKKPVDRTEWYMNPQEINAYYDISVNEICFPAGILQYPFFDMEADDAFNYGAIGTIMGHEMTHGFDDEGRQFDKDGNMCNWWKAADTRRFNSRVKVLTDWFSAIEVLPGIKANGKLTLGENIADHGGLTVALEAFREVCRDNPGEIKLGFTPLQRFFIAYACTWAENCRDELVLQMTKSDEHSLARLRVNGTLPHIDEWYEAFGITEQDSMYIAPDKRVRIW
ncbi:MAG: M13 family metallopeptidase [Bacteroidaceae bacterium]|nr:M13 family metallopeptidase [Bacteroidaceae bacterium]